MRLRRRLVRLAEEAGIGPLRRVHRTRNEMATKGLVWLLLGGGLLATTIYFKLSTVPAYAVGALTIAGYLYRVYFTDTDVAAGRYWLGTADGGLVIAPRLGTPMAVPWPAIVSLREVQEYDRPRTLELVVSDGTRPVTVRIGEVTGRRDLIRSITGQRAAPPPVLIRSIAGGVFVIAVALFAWLVFLPDFVASSESLPDSDQQLARACERAGAKYPQAAAFTGAAPHPVIAFTQDEDDRTAWELTSTYGSSTPPPGFSGTRAETQLVACIRRTGARLDQVSTCTFQQEFGSQVQTRSMREGTYTVDVFELRTHHKVGSVEIEGADTTCPSSVYGGSSHDDLYTAITPTDLQHALETYVSK